MAGLQASVYSVNLVSCCCSSSSFLGGVPRRETKIPNTWTQTQETAGHRCERAEMTKTDMGECGDGRHGRMGDGRM